MRPERNRVRVVLRAKRPVPARAPEKARLKSAPKALRGPSVGTRASSISLGSLRRKDAKVTASIEKDGGRRAGKGSLDESSSNGDQIEQVDGTPSVEMKTIESVDVLRKVFDALVELDEDSLFLRPVPRSTPMYYQVIREPMCFQSMRRKMQKGSYGTWGDFLRDFELICTNCIEYNSPSSSMSKKAKALRAKGVPLVSDAANGVYGDDNDETVVPEVVVQPPVDDEVAEDSLPSSDEHEHHLESTADAVVAGETSTESVAQKIKRSMEREAMKGLWGKLFALDSGQVLMYAGRGRKKGWTQGQISSGSAHHPLSFAAMKRRITNGEYSSLAEMKTDFQKMCAKFMEKAGKASPAFLQVQQVVEKGNVEFASAEALVEKNLESALAENPEKWLKQLAPLGRIRRVRKKVVAKRKRAPDEADDEKRKERREKRRRKEVRDLFGGLDSDKRKTGLSIAEFFVDVVEQLRRVDVEGRFEVPESASTESYYEQITHPMCFTEMRRRAAEAKDSRRRASTSSRASTVAYVTLDQVKRDFELICANCMTFYKAGSEQHRYASEVFGRGRQVLEEARLQLQDLVEALLPVSAADAEALRDRAMVSIPAHIAPRPPSTLSLSGLETGIVSNIETGSGGMSRGASGDDFYGIDEPSLKVMNAVLSETGLVGRDRFLKAAREKFPGVVLGRRRVTRFLAYQRSLRGTQPYQRVSSPSMLRTQFVGDGPSLDSLVESLVGLDTQRLCYFSLSSRDSMQESSRRVSCFAEMERKLAEGQYVSVDDVAGDFDGVVASFLAAHEDDAEQREAAALLRSKGAEVVRQWRFLKQQWEQFQLGGSAAVAADATADGPPSADLPPEPGSERDVVQESVLSDLLNRLIALDSEGSFYLPVLERESPGYYDTVKNSMCFQDMHNKLKSEKYRTIHAIEDDFRLICSNCMLYCDPGSQHYQQAMTLLQSGLKLIMLTKETEAKKRSLASGLETSSSGNRLPVFRVCPPALPPLPAGVTALPSTRERLSVSDIDVVRRAISRLTSRVVPCESEVELKQVLGEAVAALQSSIPDCTAAMVGGIPIGVVDILDSYDPSSMPESLDEALIREIAVGGRSKYSRAEVLSALSSLCVEDAVRGGEPTIPVDRVADRSSCRPGLARRQLLDRAHVLIEELASGRAASSGRAPAGSEFQRARELLECLVTLVMEAHPLLLVEKADSRALLDSLEKRRDQTAS